MRSRKGNGSFLKILPGVREELSTSSKPAVKYVGIINGRSALQTTHGEKCFCLRCLAGEVALGTAVAGTFRTVFVRKKLMLII